MYTIRPRSLEEVSWRGMWVDRVMYMGRFIPVTLYTLYGFGGVYRYTCIPQWPVYIMPHLYCGVSSIVVSHAILSLGLERIGGWA